MLKFLDGLKAGLMSGAGDVAAAGAGGGDAAAAAAAAAAPATGAAAAATDDWSFPTDKAFAEYLPKDYRADPALRDIKDFGGLVKGYVTATKMIGMDKGQVLALPATDDAKEWDGVYSKLGRPESADKYQIPKLGEGKDYSESDKAFQQAILSKLHEAGLSQRQVAKLVPAWNAMQQEAQAAQQQAEKTAIDTANAALTKEWGAAKDTKIALAVQARDHLATELKLGDDFKAALEAKDANGNALGNNPALLKVFAHLGAQLQEDGLLGKGGPSGGGGALSPAEAQQQINTIRGDAKHPYNVKTHAGHKDAVDQMQKLHEMAYPTPDK